MTEEKRQAILDILQAAIKREVAAFNYYYKASQTAPYEETEALLTQLAEEERKHRLFLTRELRRLEELLPDGTGGLELEERRMRHTLPEKAQLKLVEAAPGVDVAAISLPTELFGGDYLETTPLRTDGTGPALGIFLCDVMGHGLEATKLKALGKRISGELGEVRARQDQTAALVTPRRVMTDLNRTLYQDCQDCHRFLSAFYGIIDPVAKRLLYSSAGHEPPILVRAGGKYIPLRETDLLLGVEPDVPYADFSVPLEVGDILVLFTDGITEAVNEREVMFERERLRHVVQEAGDGSAAQILQHVLGATRRFLGNEPLKDEFTLAVLKIGEVR